MLSMMMMTSQKIVAIILASGESSRLNLSTKKQYLKMLGGTVLSCAVKPFLKALSLSELIITIPQNENDSFAKNALFCDNEISQYISAVNVSFVKGGSTRKESVYLALNAIKSNADIVLIHDAARPFVSEKIIVEVAKKTLEKGSAAPCIVPSDTQKLVAKDGTITTHLEREHTRIIQTPQGFSFKEIKSAHQKAHLDKINYTDDTEIYAKYIGKVYTVEGSVQNKKITYKEDLQMKENRIGIGYDLHRLVKGRPLIIGGVTLPSEKGCEAHSDGDALLHAITDALLGASSLSDIGTLFPDTEPEWKDASSKDLLKFAWEKVLEQGYNIVNIDCVIKLESPKFIPYRESVISSIAQILSIEENKIFVKAKTGEKLGDVGSGNAIEVWCTCLLAKH